MIRSLAITCALMAACCCTTTHAREPKTVLEKKLRNIILPKVYMLEMPLADAVAYVRAASVAYDPERKGVVNILYMPTKSAATVSVGATQAHPDGPTITMEFKDIPLGELIRYLCAASSVPLDYEVGSHVVRIFDPTSYSPPMELRAYAVPDGVFDWGNTRSRSTDKPEPIDDEDVRQMFEDMGVYFHPHGRLNYDRTAQRLIVYDTAQEHWKIARILHEFIRQPAQVQMNLTLIEVTAPTPEQAQSATPRTYAALMAIPAEQRRVIYRASTVVDTGPEDRLRDSQPATLYGQAGQLDNQCIFSTVLGEDGYTIETQLRWSISHRSTTAPIETLMRAGLQTTVVQWDRHPQVLAVHSQAVADVRHQLYLVLVPIIMKPNGQPLRSKFIGDGRF